MDIRKFFSSSSAAAKKPEEKEDAPQQQPKKQQRVVVESDEETEMGAAPATMTKPPTPANKSPAKSPTKPPASAASKSTPVKVSESSAAPKDQDNTPPAKNKFGSVVKPKPKQLKKVEEEDDEEESDGEESSNDDDDEDDDNEQDSEEPQTLKLSSSSSLALGSASQVQALPAKFDPTANVSWEKGAPVPYAEIVKVFEAIEATTKRLEIQELVSKFFRKIIVTTPQDLLPAVYLCCNTVTPAFEGVELGIGEALLKKAICESTGRSKDAVDALYKDKGDLGLVAYESRNSQKTLFGFKPAPLSLSNVRDNFLLIAKTSGNKSQEVKVGIIKKMLGACSGLEAKYIIRGLQGKLRIGLAEASVLIALAHAVALTPPTGETVDLRATLKNDPLTAAKLNDSVTTIKQVYSECPSFDEIIPKLLQYAVSELHTHCHIVAGVPLKPMLAKPTRGVSEVLDRFSGGRFTCEYKYDGERAQIHLLEDGSVKVFSRNSEDNSTKYPDVVKAMQSAMIPGTKSFIMDSEVVAYSRTEKRMLPFQILSTRARKDVKSMDDVKVQVIVCAFDLLYLNGESLLTAPLAKRRELLQQSFNQVDDVFMFAIGKDLDDAEEILGFLQEAVKNSCEGLMVKTLNENATYEPSKRSLNWLKVKKDYMDNMSDSLDLVVIGAFNGRGKRTGVFGAFLLACYDPESEEFQSICKIGTGFSEADLEEHSSYLKSLPAVPGKPKNVSSDMECDVWFEPTLVWEVRAADLSISPIHKAAIGVVDSEKGIALRFPRFLRKRDDKAAEDATTSEQVAEMYQKQAVVQNGKARDDDDD